MLNKIKNLLLMQLLKKKFNKNGNPLLKSTKTVSNRVQKK